MAFTVLKKGRKIVEGKKREQDRNYQEPSGPKKCWQNPRQDRSGTHRDRDKSL